MKSLKILGIKYHNFFYPSFLTIKYMLWTIAAILVVLWLLGVVTSYTLGGFIHILLVLAVITVLIRLIRGQQPV
jgi:hypothetical protein